MIDSKTELRFEQLWSMWLNKDRGRNAAIKALDVLLKQREDFRKIKEACEIYCITRANDEFTHQLGNFLLQHHWKDILEDHSIEQATKRRDEEIQLIDKWNEVCRPHWCKVMDKQSRLAHARKALNNTFFSESWNKALDKANKIFKYKFPEFDNRSKIILSFKWFTNVSTSHTVARILEGEYGKPAFDLTHKPKVKFIDEQEKDPNWNAAEYFAKLRKGEIDIHEDTTTESTETNRDNKVIHPFD